MRCPHDGSKLEPETYEADIEVDICGECRGMWLDQGELERIQATVERDYSAELGQVPDKTRRAYQAARQMGGKDLSCPKCEGAMSKVEHGYCSQIVVDVCPSCRGIWLDQGELQALEVFFERFQSVGDARKGFWGKLKELFTHEQA